MGVDRPIDITTDQRKTLLTLLKRHLPNTTTWAYGSRVKWTSRPQSDLDLVVFTKPEQERRVSELREAFDESNLPFRVDLLVWRTIPERYRKQIEADHAVLVAGNGDTVAENWIYRPQFPKHWKRRSLHAIAQWVNGLAFRNIQFSTTGRPVIKIAEIKEGISGQTKFTHQTFDESVRIRSGDLLFSWSGQPETSIDAFWWRGPEGWLNQHIFRVSPINGIDNTFFYYLLRYLKPNFVAIARNKQTTGLGHVTRRDLENIEVAHPDPSEQRAIAHVLGTLDDKIELNRRMNDTLEAMARALFKSWFIDFDPVRAKAALRNHSPLEGESVRQGRQPVAEPVGGGESVGHSPPHQPSPRGLASATPPQGGSDWTVGRARAYLDSLDEEIADLFPDRLVDSELGPVPEGWEVVPLPEIIEVNPTRSLQKRRGCPR